MNRLSLLASFILGACTAVAAQSTAAPDAGADAPAVDTASVAAPSDRAVTARAQAAVRVAPSGKARVSVLAAGQNAFVAELTMDGGASVPEHADATEEFIHVLEGGGSITIDGTAHELAAGDTVYMKAGATVSFQNSDAPMRAIQVFAGPEPARKYDAWAPGS